MANDMNRRGFLKYAAASALGMGALGVMTGCSSKETASSSAASTSGAVYTPGTYTASAEGYGSDVTVTVTFDETSITNVVVDSSGETENVGAAAAEKLADQVLSAQSSAIDGVTGATKTSKAVKQAVADCISQASGGAIVEGGDVAVTDDVTVGGNTDWLGTAPGSGRKRHHRDHRDRCSGGGRRQCRPDDRCPRCFSGRKGAGDRKGHEQHERAPLDRRCGHHCCQGSRRGSGQEQAGGRAVPLRQPPLRRTPGSVCG